MRRKIIDVPCTEMKRSKGISMRADIPSVSNSYIARFNSINNEHMLAAVDLCELLGSERVECQSIADINHGFPWLRDM